MIVIYVVFISLLPVDAESEVDNDVITRQHDDQLKHIDDLDEKQNSSKAIESYKSIILDAVKPKIVSDTTLEQSDEKVAVQNAGDNDTLLAKKESYPSGINKKVKPIRPRFPPATQHNYMNLFAEKAGHSPSNMSQFFTRFKRQNILKKAHHLQRKKRSLQTKRLQEETGGWPWMAALVAVDVLVALFAFNAVIALLILAT